jgi:murein DD-endopeptidase MepM/ murein hydrolase activator NlpD
LRFSALGLIVFALALPARALAWTWPAGGPVLRTFSFDRAHPYAAGQRRGVDIGAGALGEPVVTPAAGVVSFSGTTPANGLTLSIRTADGFTVSLTHLGSLAVRAGTHVVEAAPVGAAGWSGIAEFDVPYVHLGIRRIDDDNGYVDPLSLLPARVTASPPQPPPVGGTAVAPAAPPPVPAPTAAAEPSPVEPPPSAAGSAPPPPVAAEPTAGEPP